MSVEVLPEPFCRGAVTTWVQSVSVDRGFIDTKRNQIHKILMCGNVWIKLYSGALSLKCILNLIGGL